MSQRWKSLGQTLVINRKSIHSSIHHLHNSSVRGHLDLLKSTWNLTKARIFLNIIVHQSTFIMCFSFSITLLLLPIFCLILLFVIYVLHFFIIVFFLATAKGNTYEVNFIHSVKHTDRPHIHLHQRLSIAPFFCHHTCSSACSFTDYTFDRALNFFARFLYYI